MKKEIKKNITNTIINLGKKIDSEPSIWGMHQIKSPNSPKNNK